MSEPKKFTLAHAEARRRAIAAVSEAPDGWRVEVRPPRRTDGQNERFHAMCSDIAKSGFEWAGKPRTAAQWKVLLVSGHAKATDEDFEIIPGLESEFVNVRESTAQMTVRRGASLIEYAQAFCAMNGIKLRAVD